MNMQSRRQHEKKRGKGCISCLVLLIFFALVLLVTYSKFKTPIMKIIGFIQKTNTPGISTKVISKQNFTIPGALYFIKDKNLWKIAGSTITQVTTDSVIDNASISADGNTVVYTHMAYNYSDLYLRNMMTGTIKKITNNRNPYNLDSNLWALDPVISPDGAKVAYLTDKLKFMSTGTVDLSIFQINLSGNYPQEVTNAYPYTGGDQDPTYYPLNDNYLLYTKYTYRNSSQAQPFSQLYIRDMQKRISYAISPNYAGVIEPSFSSDGKYITFVQRDSRTDGQVNLYIMPFTFNDLLLPDPQTALQNEYAQRILLHIGMDAQPVFSPDGKTIAFITDSNHEFDIATLDLAYTMNRHGQTSIAGSNFKTVTANSSVNAATRLNWIAGSQ